MIIIIHVPHVGVQGTEGSDFFYKYFRKYFLKIS